MLLHRCQEHSAHRAIFLQIEERALKIVRCAWRCRNCTARFNTPSKLSHHFVLQHPDHWLAAKILIISNEIKPNDPKQSTHVKSEHIGYFLHSAFVCNRTGCKMEIGTRSQAIEHHNQHHFDYADNGNGFDSNGFGSWNRFISAWNQWTASNALVRVSLLQEIIWITGFSHSTSFFQALPVSKRCDWASFPHEKIAAMSRGRCDSNVRWNEISLRRKAPGQTVYTREHSHAKEILWPMRLQKQLRFGLSLWWKACVRQWFVQQWAA